jgi:hypothetical protein
VWLFTENGCAKAGEILLHLFCIFVPLFFLAVILREGRSRTLRENGAFLARQRRRILARFGYFQPERFLGGVPLLTLSSLIDEALAALTGSWWIHRTSAWLGRVAAALSIAAVGLFFAGLIYWCYPLLYKSIQNVSHVHLFLARAAYPFSYILIVAPAFLITAVFASFISDIVGRSSPGLGMSKPKNNLLWNVRAYRELKYPFQTVRRYKLCELLGGARALFFHSRIYSFEPAIKHMAQWISKR